MPREVYLASEAPDGGFDARTYADLHTRFSLAGMFDILDAKHADASWSDARAANAEIPTP